MYYICIFSNKFLQFIAEVIVIDKHVSNDINVMHKRYSNTRNY